MMPAVERLQQLLAALEACAREHLELLNSHRDDLIANRVQEMRRGVEVMEALTEKMRDLETVRRDTCQEIGDRLGLSWKECGWKLEDLLPHFPPEIADALRESGRRLKADLLKGAAIARENAALAQAGEKLVNDAMATLKRFAIGKNRAPAAYSRHGMTSVRPALAVVGSMEWRG